MFWKGNEGKCENLVREKVILNYYVYVYGII